ncbi:MAG: glycosyltransferase family 1 protein [Rhizobacter sp.]
MTDISPTRAGARPPPSLRILGTRGVPAAHGGFETFAEFLALYLVGRGLQVTVYCQEDGGGPVFEDQWCGVHRVHIPVAASGPKGTIVFDWRATVHAARKPGLCLTLGYNTAVFCALLRLKGIRNLINMDGIEWSRAKWGALAKTWFWLNDWAGCWLGNHLIADHPQIKIHLSTRVSPRKITTIPYGADTLAAVPPTAVTELGLEPGRFLTVIARPEPENSLLEIVQGFSQKKRNVVLVVLGNYREDDAYHRAVKAAASDEVRFVGAIYDKAVVQALRFHSMAYVHGHQVGGTNPSLVEAMGAGNAVVAHDNRFNRWVLGDAALYFSDASSVATCLEKLLTDTGFRLRMQEHTRSRFAQEFTWPHVLAQYEKLLLSHQSECAPMTPLAANGRTPQLNQETVDGDQRHLTYKSSASTRHDNHMSKSNDPNRV